MPKSVQKKLKKVTNCEILSNIITHNYLKLILRILLIALGFYHLDDISGFSCPEEKTLGPHGQPLAHPSFPHPLSCQKFITCYFSKDIKELGCMKGQVFDYNLLKCVDPEVGPEDW